MKSLAYVFAIAAGAALGACGSDEPDYTVASGLYQLTTSRIAGDCKLDYALRPGPIAIGNVMPAAVTVSAVSVDVKVCGHPGQDPSCTGLGDSYRVGLARDGNELVGSQPWLVPGCGMPDYDATLKVTGDVINNDVLSLTWTATITAAPSWTCDGYRACTSTIEQRMAVTQQ